MMLYPSTSHSENYFGGKYTHKNISSIEIANCLLLFLKHLISGYMDNGSPPVGPSRSWKSMEIEIQSLLEKLLDINDSMSRCAATASAASSVNQKLARHRDILHEYTQVKLLHATLFQLPFELNPNGFTRFSYSATFFFNEILAI